MADVKFNEFTAIGTGFVPTDIIVGVDLSANLNMKATINDFLAYPFSRGVTDQTERWTTKGSAPAVRAAGEAARYFNGTRFQVSYGGGAFKSLIEGTPGADTLVPYYDSAGSLTSSTNFSISGSTLTLGVPNTNNNGEIKLAGAATAFYTILAAQNPSANRTIYLPDNNSPTTGNFLFVGTFGATVQTDWLPG